jgi:hypothetical protein
VLPETDESAHEIRAEVLEKAEAFIEDRISVQWQQMQELVPGSSLR